MTTSFGLTFDYLCPFARNANEFVVAGLRAGAGWDVSFTPFSLAQGHVEEGDVDVWDREDPATVPGLLALQVGLAVRDRFPEAFLDVHVGLFAARHDDGLDIKDPAVVRNVLTTAGLDADAVLDVVSDGAPLETLRKEHEHNVSEYSIWGVPTFIAGGRGVFVRFLDRPEGDATAAIGRIDRTVDLVANLPELHEFKQADLPV